MFKNLSIKSRLIGVMVFLSLLLVAVGLLGLFGMSKANDGLKTVYEDRTVPLKQLSTVDRALSSNRLQMASAIIAGTPEAMKSAADRMSATIAEAGKAWDEYAATYLTPEEKKLAEKFTTDRKALATQALQPAIEALKKADVEAVKKLYDGAGRELLKPARDGIEALQKLQLDVAKEEFDAAVARYALLRNVAAGSIGAALLIAAVVGFFLLRAVVRPLNRAVEVANAVAAGDLTSHIDVHSTNETGRLLQALKTMNENLVALVSTVRSGVDTITTGSQEIASGNADLSQRTEEQASSLEETASSMEELASTVRQNGENVSQANTLAAEASQVALKGGEVVGQVVETMSSINESSKKIADIISVIDGIAFQTNILALNAAVEAARAGEQGRGFAVVASEVRTLAQRSAGAAKEIKGLISDSVSKVENGTRLVDDAGRTMQEIVTSVTRVTDIMREISSATQEQSAGIEQINEAVTQMDQVTQQNAALVEEAAAAAESMREQAVQLGGAVSVFKLGAGERAAPAVERPSIAASVVEAKPHSAKVARLPARKAAKADATAPVHAQKTGTNDDWSEF